MKKLLVLLLVAAMCMPSYGVVVDRNILVYKFTSNFDPWIDYNDANENVATNIGTKQMTGYLVFDVNLNTWELNSDPNVIFYGGTGSGKWGVSFDVNDDVNDANGSMDIKLFGIRGTRGTIDSNGLLFDIAWNTEQQRVGASWSDLYGKTGKVDIGKGITHKKDVPSNMKGIVEEWAETVDFFDALGNTTMTLNSIYTKWANTGAGKTQQQTVDKIIADLITQGYRFNEYTLTITLDPNSSAGTVTKSPNQATYHYGDVVQLTADPNTGTGWSFSGWSGGATGSDNPLTITIDGNTAVTATFTTEAEYTLTVNTDGNGTVAKSPDHATYHHGDVVTLTPTADAGWSFSGWSGDASGSGNPTTITMTGDKTVTATFTEDGYTLTVNTAGTGTGTVTKSLDKATYRYGVTVQLTAAANASSTVHDPLWGGDLSGNTNPKWIKMTSDKTVTATFNIRTYDVNSSAGAHGSISPSGITTKNYGSSQDFNATPATGYDVDTWSVDGSPVQTGGTTYTLSNITAAHTVAVSFKIQTFTITASAGAHGTLDPNGAITKDYGSSQLFTATPATGYDVNTWSLDGNSVQTGGTTYTLSTITAAHTVVVSFKLRTLTITASAGANGTLDPNGSITKYYGESQLFTATPSTGYDVNDWKVDGNSVQTGGTTYTLSTITAAHTVVVSFKIRTFTITATAGANGTLDPNGSITKDYGSSQLFTATPSAGYEVSGWTLDGNSVQTGGTTYTLSNITAAHTVTVSFINIEYTLTIDVNGTGIGTVAKAPNQATYHYNDWVNMTATADDGSSFTRWNGDASGTGNPKLIRMTGNKTVTATFTLIEYTVAITISPSGSGTVTKDPNQTTYHYGDVVQLTAVPHDPNVFSAWSGDLISSDNPEWIYIDKNEAITATFTH